MSEFQGRRRSILKGSAGAAAVASIGYPDFCVEGGFR